MRVSYWLAWCDESSWALKRHSIGSWSHMSHLFKNPRTKTNFLVQYHPKGEVRDVWAKNEKEMSQRLVPEYQYIIQSGHFQEPDFVKVLFGFNFVL